MDKDFSDVDAQEDNINAAGSASQSTIQNIELKKEFLTQYLHRVLCVESTVAKKDADAIAHHLSSETVDHMVAFVEYLTICPIASNNLLSGFRHSLQTSRKGYEKFRGCPLRQGNTQVRTLLSLRPGETGKILRLEACGAIRRRLIDMGVLPDVTVELQSIAPLGDPIKIKMKGYSLSLRKKEAQGILLKGEGTKCG